MLRKAPNTYIIIASLIIIAAILTWILPGGEYSFENGEMVYDEVNKNPQSWQIFIALQKGFVEKAGIIVFVFIVGGVFWIFNSTQSIGAGIDALLRKLQRFEHSKIFSQKLIAQIILSIIAITFSIFGAVFGMSEETIAFVGIVIPLTISLGFDSITGIAVVFVAAGLGFAGAILNPFTIGIAQEISEIPLFSGLEYRLFCWLIINIIGITYILRYTNRIYKNPDKSSVNEEDRYWKEKSEKSTTYKKKPTAISWIGFFMSFIVTIIFALFFRKSTITVGNSTFTFPILFFLSILYLIIGIFTLKKSVHYYIITLMGFIVIYLVVGVLAYEWLINEISGIFLAGGILTGLVYGMSGKEISEKFISGAKDMFGVSIVIGLAGGIIYILQEGKTIHTVLHLVSGTLEGLGKTATLELMYGFQTLMNIFIPSGSAQAAITMPIMAPFSDLVDIPRQAAVLAFQFGDGFTNMITPTSPVLMAVLGVSRVPYSKWARWFLPLLIILFIAGILLLIPPLFLNINGF